MHSLESRFMPDTDIVAVKLPQRLAALRALRLLDSDPEPAFDRLTTLAATVTKTPIALISLVDVNREYFLSAYGLKVPYATQREVPLTHSFAQFVVATAQPISVQDARFHVYGEGNQAVQDLNAIAVLGIPLTLKTGFTIGAFCLIDTKPRLWSALDVQVAQEMATSTLNEIELRQRAGTQQQSTPLSTMFDASTDLIWAADADLMFTEMNKAARTFFGIESADVRGTPLSAHLENEAYHYLRGEGLRTAAESGVWSGELYFTRHDGHQVPMSVVAAAHRDEDGVVSGWSVVARDVAASHEALQDAQHALAQEQRLTRLQGRFINTISHELRNPIANVLSSLELLIRHGSRTDPSSHYERMKKSVRDISSILDRAIRLLDDAEDETPPHVTEISLETFAREVVESATSAYEGRMVQVEIPEDQVTVHVDVAALRSVAEQLLVNALKYSTVGAHVELKIGLRDCDDTTNICQLVMYVRDRGIGIPEEDQPFIFERFYRAYNLPNVPGIGAGLYHVKRLIERMTGQIEFFSREGEGTEFVIIVPVENLTPTAKTSASTSTTSTAQSPSA